MSAQSRQRGTEIDGVPGPTQRTLITNAVVVTMNDAHDVHFGGAVAIEEDRIAAVGSQCGCDRPLPRGCAHHRCRGRGRHAGPGRPPLPHRHRARLERPPTPVADPAAVLVPGGPGHRPGGRLLGGARQLRRIDPVWRDDGQRHVPAHRRPGSGRRGDRHTRGAVQHRRRRRARTGLARGQCVGVPLETRIRERARRGEGGHRVASARLDRPPPRRERVGTRPGFGDPHPSQRVRGRGRDLEGEVRAPSDGGRVRVWAPGPGVCRRALRVALGLRDRVDARYRHPHLPQPDVERQAGERDRSGPSTTSRPGSTSGSGTTRPRA